MLFAFLMVASFADWLPARWTANDVASLDLIGQTPINCLLLEQGSWSEPFAQQATKRGLVMLGVIRPGAGDPLELARRAVSAKFAGVVLEGDFDRATAQRVRQALADSKILTIELPARSKIEFDSPSPIVGSYQGVWPGIQVEEGGATKAAPSGAPWIDTNTGFLRFARASTSKSIWIANLPPAKGEVPVERYLQAIGDASMTGARWVLALDSGFNRRLLARESSAVRDWKRIATHLQFYEDHKDWRTLEPHGNLALVEDANSGALLSGGILDMIAVKHTPVRAIPRPALSERALAKSRMAVNVDPQSLNPQQKEVLKAFTRSGGTLLTGPPGWKFPMPRENQITLDKDDLNKLDEIWKELNSMTGRRNLGARLFNVSSMLSNLLETPDGKQVVLHLVNYSDYPVESVTVHLLGSFHKARIHRPGAPEKDVATYPTDEGSGVDIDKVSAFATVVLE